MTRPQLLMIAPAPVRSAPGGRLLLDVKFVEGMRMHRAHWRGPVRVILWEGGGVPFGQDYAPADLGFALDVLPPGARLTAEHLQGAGLVLASADMEQTLDLPSAVRPAGVPLVYVVENTLGTRLRIVRLERDRGLARKLWSGLWHLRQERRRRRAFRAADAVQANGWPAHAGYRGLAPDCLMYLDGRMTRDMMATAADQEARARHLAAGGPLRIAHSGRLESIKGAQDLLPVALALQARGVDFTLDIRGAGSEAEGIAQGIAAAGLADRVRLHGPVPFETGLVPALRTEADLFLSCHRQSDPSCSYIEAMGCGLPVAGYDNAMWRALARASRSGAVAPMGDTQALAGAIADWAADRARLTEEGRRALAYAQAHDFETEFAARMDHLAGVLARRAQRASGSSGS